jgi:hypothetical protein
VIVSAAVGARKGRDWWAVNKDCSDPASRLKGRQIEEREERKGATRTYKVLLDWPLMEIPCLLALDSLLFPAVYDGQHCLEIRYNKSIISSHVLVVNSRNYSAFTRAFSFFILKFMHGISIRIAPVWFFGARHILRKSVGEFMTVWY